MAQELNQELLTPPVYQVALRASAIKEITATGLKVELLTSKSHLLSQSSPLWTRDLLDQAFEQFAAKEVKLSSEPRKDLTRPSGDPALATAGILLHYPTFTTRTTINDRSELIDPTNPCILQMLRKGFSTSSLIWHDLFCRRVDWREGEGDRSADQRADVLQARDPKVVQEHHAYTRSIVDQMPIWLLAGKETSVWYKQAYYPQIVRVGNLELFVNYDQKSRQITRLAVPCCHPHSLFYPNRTVRVKMDQQANLFAALLDDQAVRTNYFEAYGDLNYTQQAIFLPRVPFYIPILQARQADLVHYDPFDQELQQAMINELQMLANQLKSDGRASFSKAEFESLGGAIKAWLKIKLGLQSSEDGEKFMKARSIFQVCLPDIMIKTIRSDSQASEKRMAVNKDRDVMDSDTAKFYGFRQADTDAGESTRVLVFHNDCLGARSDLKPAYTSDGIYVSRKIQCYYCGKRGGMHPVDLGQRSGAWEMLHKAFVKYQKTGEIIEE